MKIRDNNPPHFFYICISKDKHEKQDKQDNEKHFSLFLKGFY